MYVPKIFKETELQSMQSLVAVNPLGTWITCVQSQLEVNHIPFVLDTSVGDFGVLKGHINKANPICSASIEDSVVVFNGVDTYVTPSWYTAKQTHGRVVPTWNYQVVHAHGTPVFKNDSDWLLEHLSELTNQHEGGRSQPWAVDDAPAVFIEKMMNGIIGIEIEISKMEGVCKASQNKTQQDRLQIAEGLNASRDSAAVAMAALVAKND